ncbi:hypothetical protein BDV10DRAFT_198666 [Aspergillus recurvatus]
MAQPTGFPSLRPAYILKANHGLRVAFGDKIGRVQSGSEFTHYSTPEGTISTVAGFCPVLNAEVVFAGDWLYFDADKQHARMNVKGVARTVDGDGINFSYFGVSRVSPELTAIFSGQPRTIPFGLSTTHNTFEVGSPSLKELENSTWVGNGRFKSDDGKLLVEIRISQVVASNDME